jgi:hypothetical protein
MKQRGKILFLVLALAFILISLSNFSQAGTLKVTEEHPFLINGTWIPASDLKVGDELTTIDGKKVRITNINDVETKEPFPVYNLEAGKYHDFVVDGGDGVGVVVHNSNSLESLIKAKRIRGVYDITDPETGRIVKALFYEPKGIKPFGSGSAVWDRQMSAVKWTKKDFDIDTLVRANYGIPENEPWMLINGKPIPDANTYNALYHEFNAHILAREGEGFAFLNGPNNLLTRKPIIINGKKFVPTFAQSCKAIPIGVCNSVISPIQSVAYMGGYKNIFGFVMSPYTGRPTISSFIDAVLMGTLSAEIIIVSSKDLRGGVEEVVYAVYQEVNE